jgi:thiosulfate reductase cytochrome b subunit
MIYWALLALGIAFTIITYVRNRQRDKARHRRERLQEKQEALLETLRKRKQEEQDNTE